MGPAPRSAETTVNAQRETLLIVDDELFNLNVLVDLLGPDYDTMVAKNGETALKRAWSDQRPDMVLLDIMMPGMDGYEVCRQLKADPRTQDIPVIFITALGETRNEAKGLTLGAVDYITKPLSLPIVKARVKTHLAMSRNRRELAKKNSILESERELVEHVVASMRRSIRFDGRHITTYFAPLEEASGDLLLGAFRPDGTQHLLVGDFTGHGLTAAIAGPLVSDLFYTRTAQGEPIARIISEVNALLCDVLPADRYLVGSFVELSTDRRQLQVYNCGMPEAWLFRSGSLHARISSNQFPRGLLRRPERPPVEIPVEPGDKLYLYSDGAIEERNPQGDMLGEERFESLLSDVARAERPLESLQEALAAFRGSAPQSDDILVVALTC